MKISPAIPTRTVAIVVMLVRLDPGMVLPPLFREMRLLLGESEFRGAVRLRPVACCGPKHGGGVPAEGFGPGSGVGAATRVVRRLCWSSRASLCAIAHGVVPSGSGMWACPGPVTNPDTPCRPHLERGAAALKTG